MAQPSSTFTVQKYATVYVCMDMWLKQCAVIGFLSTELCLTDRHPSSNGGSVRRNVCGHEHCDALRKDREIELYTGRPVSQSWPPLKCGDELIHVNRRMR